MQEERATGAEPLTQFGRMCAQLGIRIIPASSPQAKGRIERHHGTHQDRLVKKLRRKGIARFAMRRMRFSRRRIGRSTIERFAGGRRRRMTFTCAIAARRALDAVFRLEETRRVSNDWVVRYDNRFLQIERQSHHPPAAVDGAGATKPPMDRSKFAIAIA